MDVSMYLELIIVEWRILQTIAFEISIKIEYKHFVYKFIDYLK